MISSTITFSILLFAYLIHNQQKNVHAGLFWDDYDYYYTYTVTTTTYEVFPQDEEDAQAIVNSKMNEQTIASIIPFREKIRRITINKEITVKNAGIAYIDDNYVTLEPGTPRFKDLVFGLAYDEASVIGTYLGVYLKDRDETMIIICLVLTKDMDTMKNVYDQQHFYVKFDERRKDQRKPFKNMMTVWVSQNREPNEKTDLCQKDISDDATALKAENDNGGWHENRDKIEKILMKKSVKYAKAVIQEFEKLNGDKSLEDIIQENVQAHGLNHDLADAYCALACYVRNKYKYISNILHKYSCGSERWAVWIMCIAVLDPKEWPKVNEIFKTDHKKSLSEFIVQHVTEDKIMGEMMAVVIDPSYKPTQFEKKPTKDEATKPCTPPPATQTASTPCSG